MSDRKSLLEWFGMRRESVVMSGLKNHARAVQDTVSELNRAVGHLCKEEKDKAIEALNRMMLSEKEADSMEGAITQEISKGELESKERGDLMHMVRRIDSVADWAKESGMNLQLILEAKVKVPAQLWQRYCAMTRELETAAKELKLALDYVGLNNEEAIKHCDQVERQEHTLDDMYFKTKKEILFSDTDPRAVFLLRDMLHGIENSSDSSKDVADSIRIMIASEARKAR